VTVDDDDIDTLVGLPGGKSSVERPDHAVRQGIERLRPCQRDDAGPAQMFKADLVASAKIHRERIPPPRRRD